MSDTPQLLALMQKTRGMKAYDCVKEFESLARKLEKENIALREDKARLDWLESLHSLWEGTEKTGPVFLTRAAIDAARWKEPQP